MGKQTPLVSIVLPVYNNQSTIKRAINSILQQRYSNFELLIVNDGSSDRSLQLIKTFTDQRIIIFNQPTNSGLAACLNLGIKKSRGQFIVRMDADDYALPNRIGLQIGYLLKHPQVDLLGTFIQDQQSKRIIRYPLSDSRIRASLLVNNPLAHPTVCFRKTTLLKHQLFYNETYRQSQDYEFWCRIFPKVHFANLPLPLLIYDNYQKTSDKQKYLFSIRQKLFKQLYINLTPNIFQLTLLIDQPKKIESLPRLQKIEEFFEKIWRQNKQIKLFPQNALKEVLGLQLFISYLHSKVGGEKWNDFFRSQFFFPSLKALVKYFLNGF